MLGWLLLALAALACALALLKAPAAPTLPLDLVPEVAQVADEPPCTAEPVAAFDADRDGCDRDWSCVPLRPLALDSPHLRVGGGLSGRPQFDASPPQRPPRALA